MSISATPTSVVVFRGLRPALTITRENGLVAKAVILASGNFEAGSSAE